VNHGTNSDNSGYARSSRGTICFERCEMDGCGHFTRQGEGRFTPYADPRAYTDRLNEVVTERLNTGVHGPHRLTYHPHEERQGSPERQGTRDVAL
jgi:hypothetical protein